MIMDYGNGKVFAVGSPWLYNENLNQEKFTKSFENFLAADELARWALKQVLPRKIQH